VATSSSRGRVQRRSFPGITAEAFVSLRDRAALTSLQQMPLLPPLVRKFNEVAGDRLVYLQNSAGSVRCGPRQLPTLHRLMQEAAEILDVPEPEIYLQRGAVENALTAGVSRPFIVLSSALVENFTNDELLFVIGHELGHVKCGHVLYQTVGRLLLPLLEALGSVTMGIGQLAGIGLVSGFYEWLRQAEFSADRAGLLVCQDTRVACTAIMKLGGGGTRLDGEMNVDAFLEQARQHAESTPSEGIAKALLFFVYNWQLSHPQVVFRARDLDQWVQSGEYERILGGHYLHDEIGGSQPGPQAR
jgi:Zn-dependent protease with chaperone function